MRRLPSLDGVRAISIGLVLLGHELHFASSRRIGDLANLGVRCFFVLSGFLITTLLLEEYATRGRISIRDFYARRTLRIFPAAYFFLLVVFVLERFGLVESIGKASWLHAVTYTMDYLSLSARAWDLGHLWSLAVEEQFYLLWPTLLVLLRPRKALRLVVAVIVLVPLVRWATWRFYPTHAPDMKWQFHTVCDALATGCLLAGCREKLWTNAGYRRFLRSAAFAVVPVAVLIVNWFMVGRLRFNYLAGQTLINVGIALCIDRVVRMPDGIVGRVLNWKPVAHLGVLSYSIYLWQQPIFNPAAHSWLNRFPVNLAAVVAAAWLSYTFVEKPFLGMRKRFSRGTSPSPSGIAVEAGVT